MHTSDSICYWVADRYSDRGRDQAKSKCFDEKSNIGRRQEFGIILYGQGGVNCGTHPTGHMLPKTFIDEYSQGIEQQQN
jgi:hypothetical protein